MPLSEGDGIHSGGSVAVPSIELGTVDVGLVAFLTAAMKGGALVLVGLAILSGWDLLKTWLRTRRRV
jgi:hypothetical protein